MDEMELGITDVHVLPGIAAAPERWCALRDRLNRRVFLRSEGVACALGEPHVVTGALLAQSTELVARINRFYQQVAAAFYTRPDLRPDYLVNPLLEPMLDIEAAQTVSTPLSRLDAVLGADDALRVIEINSVGICQFHVRNLLYLIRGLARGGFAAEAEQLDRLATQTVVDGFLRYAKAHHGGDLPARPVVGMVTPSGWFRASQPLFRAAFDRAGVEYVYGGPEHLDVTSAEVRMRGTRVDIVWADFFLYMAYQAARYKETKFLSRVPDFGETPAQAAALLSNPHFLDHVRARRIVNLSPARSYLALPKSLLAWIHRTDRPIDEADRAWLVDHVARTYGMRERTEGHITVEDVVNNRGEYLLKPCQYGASHGVTIGRVTDAAMWRERVAQVWNDPGWAVQAYHEPIKATSGEWVSVGLSNLDGTLGGFYFRTSPSLLVNARDARFLPAISG